MTSFDTLLDEFRPAPTAKIGTEWEGDIPESVLAFVERCIKFGAQERPLTDLDAAAELRAVLKAACDAHEPKLSLRFKAFYQPILDEEGHPLEELRVDSKGVQIVDSSGKPIYDVLEDTTKLRAVRVSVSPYSPRGGGKRGATKKTT